jgi:undecaprenyl phosphate N,N'-diacetylbacillosamine 1-phosphate transferase
LATFKPGKTLTALARSFYARKGKRILDLMIVVPAMLLMMPVFAAIALLIRLTSKGPVFFHQERLGLHGVTFNAIKFRTMTDEPRIPDTVAFSGDASAVTAVGKYLRRYKLDELPQIFNVLTGEMSIVGPRPQLPVQLAEFDENAKLRLLVRPGLTGMAQTHGNVTLTWPERWYFDALYVRNMSLALDLRLIVMTVGVLIRGEEHFLTRPPSGGAAAD